MKSFNLLVEQLKQIPSIGRKSALKIAYTLAIENKILALNIAHCIESAIQNVRSCEICGGMFGGQDLRYLRGFRRVCITKAFALCKIQRIF